MSVTSSLLRLARRAASSIWRRTSPSRSCTDESCIGAAIGTAMPARQPLPRAWLVTDERQGERLLPAVERLPFGSGVLFRHHGFPEAERHALFLEIRTIARRRAHLLLLAGSS